MIISSFKSESIGKGELANRLYTDTNTTIDCALPQLWIDKVSRRFSDSDLAAFGNLSGHFVYVYDDNDNGHKSEYIAPLTKTGCKILGILSLYA